MMFDFCKFNLLTVSFIAMTVTSSVAENAWSHREVCRAATKVYFWLNELPTDASDQDGFFGFRSAASNYYRCQVIGRSVHFSWLNDDADEMLDENTTYRIVNNRLIVTTDLTTDEFIKN